MKYKAHDYQNRAMQWIINHRRCALFLDMGLGKTVITLTAIDALQFYDPTGKVLVIAPKRVVTDTWATEAQKWEHLKALKVLPIVGDAKHRRNALEQEADVYVISRDNVRWLVNYLGVTWDFDTLVIDELSSFKNPQSGRFKALRKVAHRCSRVIGLTGTPAPNGYGDLWSQMFLIDGGERLGRTLGDFRRKYCEANYFAHFTTYYVPETKLKDIDEKIKDVCISMTAKDYLSLPPVSVINHEITLEPKAKRAYETMKREAVLELGEDAILGVNAAAVANKLSQIASGFVYTEEGTTQWIHDAKIEALQELIEGLQGEPCLIFYQFKADAELIKDKINGVRELQGSEEIRDWNDGKIEVLITHPASAGHGLNLQQGGRTIVWYGLPWSLELYQQANARLNRQGQTKPVMIHQLIAKGTIDERVMRALDVKKTTQDALIDCVKAELGVK